MLNDYFNELKNSDLSPSFESLLNNYRGHISNFRRLLADKLVVYESNLVVFKEFTNKLISSIGGLKNFSLSLGDYSMYGSSLFQELSDDFMTSSINMINIISEVNVFSLRVFFDSKRISNLLVNKINEAYTKLVLENPDCFFLPSEEVDNLSRVINEPISKLSYYDDNFSDVYQLTKDNFSLIEKTVNDFIKSNKDLAVDCSFSDYWNFFIRSLVDFSSSIDFHKRVIDLTSSLKEFVFTNKCTIDSYCSE